MEETMTQNTLAELRCMEHAAEDKKDRYLLGLCTLFVATIEDAKDRISQVELVFCNQLFPAFQTKLMESRQAVQEAENLYQKSLQNWESSKEDLLRDIEELHSDRESLLRGKETIRSELSDEIHKLHQELLGFRQEEQVREEEASECKIQLQEKEILQKRLSSEIEELQQELLRLRKEKELQAQEDLHRNPQQEDESALHREGRLSGNGPPQSTVQSEFEKLSEEAAELRQINSKLQQENQDIHQHCSNISSELGLLKSRMFPSETSSTVAETEALDSKSLQVKLEQKSQERSLECFRRQLLSTEVEKEKKATHVALVKLHTLRKQYRSLRKQYTVLFRHNHPLEQQKQVESDLADASVER